MEFWASDTDEHLPQSPFTDQFFSMTTFCTAFFESYLCTWLGWGSPAGGSLAGAPCLPEKEATDHTKLSGDFLKIDSNEKLGEGVGKKAVIEIQSGTVMIEDYVMSVLSFTCNTPYFRLRLLQLN